MTAGIQKFWYLSLVLSFWRRPESMVVLSKLWILDQVQDDTTKNKDPDFHQDDNTGAQL
jgi:hypothetical protein